LLRYCQGVIYFDAEISDRAFDLGMSEQELDGPQISCSPVDKGSFRASQRMRPKQPRVALDIYGILLNAHWSISFPEYLEKPPNNFLVQGGWIESSNDDASQNAADALFDALKSTAVGMGRAKGKFSQVQFDSTKPLVWIFIGDKPTPLRSWITP
jgi:hypothetical protein